MLALTAKMAVFTNATALTLTGLANSTSWVKFPPAPKSGALSLVSA